MSPFPDQPARLADFCRRWGVAELWLFGSAARGQARQGRDADILVRFAAKSTTST